MRMSEDERAPGIDEVEVAGAVDVVQVLAGAACDEKRCAAHGAKRAHRRIDATRDDAAGARIELP